MAKTDTNIRVELVKTNKSLLGETEITNGCVWFVDDTKELFFDFDSKRSEVKDILVLQQEAERTSILFAPLNKFYFVLETQVLWFYKDGSWYKVSPDLSVFYTKAEIDSLIYGYLRLRNVTYSELVNLKSNSKLETGAYYRITDYVTTTNGASTDSNEPSRSAGHQFDIIIQALGPSNLAEIGTCALHEGDTYFAGQNISAWQIWYHLENDKTKYQWADTENGKGVIYRMIDERNNDFPYDFKNIQFYRDSTLDKYSAVKSRLVAEDGYYYTMTDTTNGITDFSMASNDNTNNKMLPTIHNSSNNAFNLNNTIFLQYTGTRNVQNNTFGIKCHNNTLFDTFSNVVLDGYFYSNIIGSMFYSNDIGGYFHNNIISSQFDTNNIMGYFQNNTITGNFKYNTVDNGMMNNVITGTCTNNSLSGTFQNNNISAGFVANVIESEFMNNTTSAGFARNHIRAGVQYCNFGSYFYLNYMFGNTQYVKTPSGTKSSKFMNNIINTLNGTSSALIDLTGLPMGQKYNVNVSTDINNKIIATWNELGVTKGKYKETASSTEWKNITPEYYTTTEIDAKLGNISSLLDSINGEV